MGRFYRSIQIASANLNIAGVAAAYAQIKSDIIQDGGWNAQVVVDGDSEYLLFWPAIHGATPDHTNDDVPIWGMKHSVTAIQSILSLFPCRYDVTTFDGTQYVIPRDFLISDDVYWDGTTWVSPDITLFYASASDVPVFSISRFRSDWDGSTAIKVAVHYVAATSRRLTVDMGNGYATRYLIAEFDTSYGYGYFFARSINVSNDYDPNAYADLWSPIYGAGEAVIDGIESAVPRTAFGPLFQHISDTGVIRAVFGELNGLHLMAGKATARPEAIATGFMAVGPLENTNEIGQTLVIPVCPPAP